MVDQSNELIGIKNLIKSYNVMKVLSAKRMSSSLADIDVESYNSGMAVEPPFLQ